MKNQKSNFHIKTIVFLYSIVSIAMSFMIMSNLFYSYMDNYLEKSRIILGETMCVIEVMLNLFVVYYGIKTILSFSICEKFKALNETSAFLFVSSFMLIVLERFFILKDERAFEISCCIPLVLWLLITFFMISEKQKFIRDLKNAS